MKKLAIIALTIFTVTIANATSVKRYLRTGLTQMSFQEGTELALENFVSGNMNIDFMGKKINLTFLKKVDCPPNAFCIMPEMMIPTKISADLRSATTNRCGVSLFSAVRNENGKLIKIQVIDNSNNTCPILTDAVYVPTSITLTIESNYSLATDPIQTKEIHRFLGDVLR